jgi:hypothetical protein
MKKYKKNNEVQANFFKSIEPYVPKNQQLVNAVSKVLGMSNDAAYRRIRGTTLLDFEELTTLCHYFGLSFDSVINMNEVNQIKCLYTPLNVKDETNLMAYLNNVVTYLEGIETNETSEMIFTVSSVPFICLGMFRDLVKFNFFSWSKNIYGVSGNYVDFINSEEMDKLMQLFDRAVDKYVKLPSFEIWSTGAISSFVKLLNFHHVIGSFADNRMPIHLCQQMLSLLENFQLWTEKGMKFPHQTSIKFYVCDAGIDSTFVLFKNKEKSSCLVKLFTVNNLIISDKRFCIEMESWIRNLSQQSTLISESAAMERFNFFSAQRKRVTDYMVSLNGR